MRFKKALLIGVDKYDNLSEKYQLPNCIRDAEEIQLLLEDQENKFTCIPQKDPTHKTIKNGIKKVLTRNTDHALIYFSGHGLRDPDSGSGYLVGRDHGSNNIGVSMEWLTQTLNESKVPEITLILDCCFAGSIQMGLRENISILAATQEDDFAGGGRRGDNSEFTKTLLQGLKGAAADLDGNINISSLYQHADASLSILQQRPVFKSFIDKATPIRVCKPLVPREEISKIIGYKFFQTKESIIDLSGVTVPKKKQEEKLNRFVTLCLFEKAGLIECNDQLTLFQATLRGGSCRLNIKGQFVWDQIIKK